MRDPYQTSMRNFGPSKPRRAPVDEVEAHLHQIGKEIHEASLALAALPCSERASLQEHMNKLVQQQATLQFERDRIIREFFNH
jgi:hypothetical protein